jgi:hypothetical protein
MPAYRTHPEKIPATRILEEGFITLDTTHPAPDHSKNKCRYIIKRTMIEDRQDHQSTDYHRQKHIVDISGDTHNHSLFE